MPMLQHQSLRLRRLDVNDLPALQRILETSDYTSCHFGPEELPGLLERMPAVGAFVESSRLQKPPPQTSLQAFLLVNWLVPPSAWLGGFGVIWSQGSDSEEYLDLLVPKIEQYAAARGAHTLYYSSSNLDTDWLRTHLEARNFRLHSLLRSYDKEDFTIPDQGNLGVQVRQFEPGDAAGTVAVEDLAFEQLWRHDAASFLQVRQYYPYFVVALDEQGIAGYQYNTVDMGIGYLVRIAVHPRAEGHGIGTRLMAEAVRYFQAHQVDTILLNAEETNQRAQSLYLRFGFHLAYSRGFVLERDIAGPTGR
ncbi:MAG: GNAT family N-acetyltransferase [Ktedonobacterales bacterium]